ncbi:hypothetical protein SISNIDRAFT_488055 [Sistotremastrum niveocremeum HHB9708]|uniref:Uncharacterized protein n=1 Tax=Sistotremastrum niveocremeum HHB9708 TaxID=1314777 RepID=A0A164RPN7_9AGAM|nr:hypothetical protein SISNIDRAFT_488055 [Sistotremastrum niveocremeum HHB9708]
MSSPSRPVATSASTTQEPLAAPKRKRTDSQDSVTPVDNRNQPRSANGKFVKGNNKRQRSATIKEPQPPPWESSMGAATSELRQLLATAKVRDAGPGRNGRQKVLRAKVKKPKPIAKLILYPFRSVNVQWPLTSDRNRKELKAQGLLVSTTPSHSKLELDFSLSPAQLAEWFLDHFPPAKAWLIALWKARHPEWVAEHPDEDPPALELISPLRSTKDGLDDLAGDKELFDGQYIQENLFRFPIALTFKTFENLPYNVRNVWRTVPEEVAEPVVKNKGKSKQPAITISSDDDTASISDNSSDDPEAGDEVENPMDLTEDTDYQGPEPGGSNIEVLVPRRSSRQSARQSPPPTPPSTTPSPPPVEVAPQPAPPPRPRPTQVVRHEFALRVVDGTGAADADLPPYTPADPNPHPQLPDLLALVAPLPAPVRRLRNASGN